MVKTKGVELLTAWMAEDSARTQMFIAERLGISQPTVSYWLKLRTRPGAHLRASLQKLAGIPETAWFTSQEVKSMSKTEARIKRPAPEKTR